MTTTVVAQYNSTEDSIYLYNQLRQLSEDQRLEFVSNELEKLDSYATAASTPIFDIIYMRKIWRMVQKKLELDAKPKTMVDLPRNVRYSKRYE